MPERHNGERRYAPDDGGRYEAGDPGEWTQAGEWTETGRARDERRHEDQSRHTREQRGGAPCADASRGYDADGDRERYGRESGTGGSYRGDQTGPDVGAARIGREYGGTVGHRRGARIRREPMRDLRTDENDLRRRAGERSGAYGRDDYSDYDDYGESGSPPISDAESYRGRDYGDRGYRADRDEPNRGRLPDAYRDYGRGARAPSYSREPFGNRDLESQWRDRWLRQDAATAYQSGVRDGWSGGSGDQPRGSDYTRPLGPYSGRGPRGYARADERIREEICDLLTADHDVDASDVEVVVERGEVTLTGNVADRTQKRAAEDLADDVVGVTQVHNRLRVERAGYGDATRAGTDAAGTCTPPGQRINEDEIPSSGDLATTGTSRKQPS